MAQTQSRIFAPAPLRELNCLLSSPVDTYTPSSPDPTPLRMLAFSVAESALQADPNSPAFTISEKVATGDWPSADQWGKSTTTSRWSAEPPKPSLASRRGQNKMWDVIDKARERRERRARDCEYPSVPFILERKLICSIPILCRVVPAGLACICRGSKLLAHRLQLCPANRFTPWHFRRIVRTPRSTLQARSPPTLPLAHQAILSPIHPLRRAIAYQVDFRRS